jgi:hypothetical protein
MGWARTSEETVASERSLIAVLEHPVTHFIVTSSTGHSAASPLAGKGLAGNLDWFLALCCHIV